MDPTEFKNELLEGLAPDEIRAFLRRCKKSTYARGTELFREHTPAKTMYLLAEGEVDLRFRLPGRDSDTTIAREKAGQSIGWSTIVPPFTYLLSAHAFTPITVYEIDADALNEMFETNYHLAFIFMRNLTVLIGERFHKIQDELTRVRGDEAITGW
ncbi:MAG: cyclic nucleotide-binding domain-containing protein [Spirochaetia bacterium]|nr:cyclic nucleotide-binding domain-containing protein [Spirochaetia bacterium]